MTKTIFSKDPANKRMLIQRAFSAPLEQVWKAWTDSALLDQWWAPKPWKAVTKSMEFKEGGVWLYYMQGPEGEQSWAKATYKNIIPLKSFETVDAFCDEQGVDSGEFPSMQWRTAFKATEHGTSVEIEITFASPEDMEKIVELGFQEGFEAAHDNLDELLAN